MKVNYVLMYGTPYLKYRAFETFEDISKFLVNKGIVNYSIFKKLEDKEEVEMIYRDNDICYLENLIKEQDQKLQQKENIIKEVREYCNNDSNFEIMTDFDTFENHNIIGKDILEILDKVGSDKE